MFKQIRAGISSIAQRKLVQGVGTNDVDYQVTIRIEGKKYRCPYYHSWCRMLERCYSENNIVRSPSYINCTVADEWLIFSNFRKWMVLQDWQGKELDKDIRVPGNKLYSKETCMFVSKTENCSYRQFRKKIIKKPPVPRDGNTTFVNGVEFPSAGAAAKFIFTESGRSTTKNISRRIRKFLANPKATVCNIYNKYEIS